MTRALCLLGLVLLLGGVSRADPIDDWVARLATDPMWGNGNSPILDLPRTATTREVVTKILQMTKVPGAVVSYKILEIKKVRITGSLPDLYTAVLIKPGESRDVVLLQYTESGWWSRVLSVP